MTDHVAYENRKQNQAREKLGVKLGSNASYVKGHRAMNDDVKDALELARSSAASKCQCLDCRALRALIPHIDGEPARLAAALETQLARLTRELSAEVATARENFETRLRAAVAAAREEQREADAKFCPNCLGVGFVERPVPCPYCDDSTHDHYCPTGTQRQQCGCGAARIRATPLTATPLADEIAALRARVAELEAEQEVRDDVMTAEQRLKFWADNPHACPNHFGARTACAQCFDSLSQQFTNLQIEHEAVLRDSRTAEAERDALRAQVEAEKSNYQMLSASYDHAKAEAKRSFDFYFAQNQLLRSQVEAARTYARQSLDYGEDCDAHDLLKAMDEAKP